MENIFDIIKEYNPEAYSRLIRSDLNNEAVDLLIKEKTGQYLPSDVKNIFLLFNGTKETFINEDNLYQRISPECLLFKNGYLSSLEKSLFLLEKHSKYLIKKEAIYFPVFLTGYEIFFCVKLLSMPSQKDNNGLFQIIGSKKPMLIYDTFESFELTTIECYKEKVYYYDHTEGFCCDVVKENDIIAKNNPKGLFGKSIN